MDGGLTPEEVEANCDLIAAAPELLKALEAMLQIYGDSHDKDRDELETYAITLARAAIAKANGIYL